MNQPPLPPASVNRPTGAADAPDVLFVLRRHIWLIVIGTILCTGASAGLWAYLYRTSPRYTASVTYQVLAPPIPPAVSNFQQATPSPEEITRFIRRQAIFIKSDPVIERALQTDEFQHDYRDPTSAQHSRWLTENIAQAKKRLKEDVSVTPEPTSDVYYLKMTARDPVEAAKLVNAISHVYEDQLRVEARTYQNQHQEELGKSLMQQGEVVKGLQNDLDNFRRINKIDAITPRYTLQLQVLGDLDKRLTEIEGYAAAAQATLQFITEQAKNNELQLSADANQRFIENDSELRYLSQTRLSLEQNKAVAQGTGIGNSGQQVRALDAQIAELDRQAEKRRQTQEAEGRKWMQQNAKSEADSLMARAQYLMKARELKNTEVGDLDKFLVQAQQMSDALKAQMEVLTQLRQENARELLKSDTDETRVRKLGGDANPPDDISWPIWYKFWVPAGFVIGVLLSFGAAYLFELTNTRVRTPFDITRTLQMPLLGFVPDQQDDSAVTGELSTSIRTAPSSMIAESFRQIRGRLIAEGDGDPVKSLLIASVAPGGGATTVASNVANGMALNDKRVLLIDANFYRPGLRNCYKNIPDIGLADVVASPEKLDAAIVPSADMANLFVMGTGSLASSSPSEMFESKAFRELLDAVKARYDMVIFDGAPLSLVSDSVALGARVDGVIAVVRAGEVSRGTVARVREQLRQVRAHFLGAVLNAAQTHGAGYFKENYRTFHRYAGQGARTNGASVH